MRERNVFVSVFWGPAYVATFLRLSLPSILSRKNLTALASLEGPEYLIYTQQEYIEMLNYDPLIVEVRNFFPVRILKIPSEHYTTHPHDLMRLAYIDCIRYAANLNAAIWFLMGEYLWADGTLETIAQAAQDGKSAFLGFAPRVGTKALDLLLEDPAVRAELSRSRLTLSCRQVGALSVQAPSFKTNQIHYPGSPLLYNWVAYLIWRLGGHATLTRGVHMCPIYLAPDVYFDKLTYSLDGDLVRNCVFDWRRIYIPQDSDQFALVSYCPDEPKEFEQVPDRPLDLPRIARWMAQYTGEFEQYLFFNKPILYHDGSDLSASNTILQQQEEDMDKLKNLVSKYRQF